MMTQSTLALVVLASCAGASVRRDAQHANPDRSSTRASPTVTRLVADRYTTCLTGDSAHCWGRLFWVRPHQLSRRPIEIGRGMPGLYLLGWQPCVAQNRTVVCPESAEAPAVVTRFLGNGIAPIAAGHTHGWAWARTERRVFRAHYTEPDTEVEVVFGSNTEVVSGAKHACILDGRAGVHCFGDNEYGQCGVSLESEMVHNPTRVGVPAATQIAAGQFHTCALADARMYCWGSMYDPELDFDHREPSPEAWHARLVELEDSVLSIAATQSGACAALANGSVWCVGRVERFSTPTQPVPFRSPAYEVHGLPPAEWDLAAGWEHVCAIRRDEAEVWCWGDNGFGQIGAGLGDASELRQVPGITASSIVSVGERPATCAQTSTETSCWGWGFGDDATRVNVTRPIQDSGGQFVITDDGRVWQWAGADLRSLDQTARALAAGSGRYCLVSVDGRTLTCTHDTTATTRQLPVVATDVFLTNAAECVLSEAGEVSCRHNEQWSVARVNVDSACGSADRLCVVSGGEVQCRDEGEDWRSIEVGTEVVRLRCGQRGRICAVDDVGVVRCERTRGGEVEPLALENASDIAVGDYHQCVLAQNQVLCSSFQPGFDGNVLGRRENVLAPTRVVGLP